MPQLQAEAHPAGRLKSTTPIEVKMSQSGEVSAPAEFQVALYEDLLRKSKFIIALPAPPSDSSEGAPAKIALAYPRCAQAG